MPDHEHHRVYATTTQGQRVPVTEALSLNDAHDAWARFDAMLHPEYHQYPRRWRAPQDVFLDAPDNLVGVAFFSVRSTDDPGWPASAPTYRRTI